LGTGGGPCGRGPKLAGRRVGLINDFFQKRLKKEEGMEREGARTGSKAMGKKVLHRELLKGGEKLEALTAEGGPQYKPLDCKGTRSIGNLFARLVKTRSLPCGAGRKGIKTGN